MLSWLEVAQNGVHLQVGAGRLEDLQAGRIGHRSLILQQPINRDLRARYKPLHEPPISRIQSDMRYERLRLTPIRVLPD